MGTNLSDLYSNALGTYSDAARNSAIDRTRARGVLEQLSPLVQQDMKNKSVLDQTDLSGQFSLADQRLKNIGQLNTQTLANKWRLKDRKLANQGAWSKQYLANIGRGDVQRMSDQSALERLGITNKADLNRARIQGEFGLTKERMRDDTIINEGKANRLATLETPKYMEVRTGLDIYGKPIYDVKNVNTVAAQTKSKNVGSITPKQIKFFNY